MSTDTSRPTLGDDTLARFSRDWDEWHRGHESRRADKHGFLAITGITWLTTSAVTIEDAPGTWSTSPEGGPVVDLADGEELQVNGVTVTGRYEFGPIAERGGVTVHYTPPTGGPAIAIEVARRGGNDIVRPRNPQSAILAAYTGTPVFEPDPHWTATGTFVAFDTPRETTVGSVAEGLTHVYAAPGYVDFELHGAKLRLTAFNGYTPGSLNILFTDATSGVTTYAANRSLALDAPDASGRVVLDFNRATNLPCAYTPHATCPLPPAENRLAIGIEAGEKSPLDSFSIDGAASDTAGEGAR